MDLTELKNITKINKKLYFVCILLPAKQKIYTFLTHKLFRHQVGVGPVVPISWGFTKLPYKPRKEGGIIFEVLQNQTMEMLI